MVTCSGKKTSPPQESGRGVPRRRVPWAHLGDLRVSDAERLLHVLRRQQLRHGAGQDALGADPLEGPAGPSAPRGAPGPARPRPRRAPGLTCFFSPWVPAGEPKPPGDCMYPPAGPELPYPPSKVPEREEGEPVTRRRGRALRPQRLRCHSARRRPRTPRLPRAQAPHAALNPARPAPCPLHMAPAERGTQPARAHRLSPRRRLSPNPWTSLGWRAVNRGSPSSSSFQYEEAAGRRKAPF